MTLPTSNLASMLVHAAQHFGDRPGLIQGDRVWTWTEINDRVTRAASALAARGVKQGDRVLVHSRNCNAMFETQWACWRLGAVWVPTNFRLTPPEVAYLASSSRATTHIFDTGFPDHAAAAKEANAACENVFWIGLDAPGEDWEAPGRRLQRSPTSNWPTWTATTSAGSSTPRAPRVAPRRGC